MNASYSSTPLPAGTMIGPYAIIELIARGGMSVVYRARHSTLQDEVALKILQPNAIDDELAARFLREGQAMARLRHPNIVQVFNADTFNGLQYLAMEYAPNGTLKRLLAYAKQLPVEQALLIAQQMAEALDYAHTRGVIHRDIKPSNILCVDEQRFVLADFGIADDQTGNKITRTRSTMGTLEYMAPEQAQGQVADGRSDVYSLGIVLYEMLVGKPPFEAETMVGLIHKHAKETPATIHRIRPEVPAAVSALVGKAIAKTPKDRFQTAGEMATAISAQMGLHKKPSLTGRPWLTIAGVALLILVGALVWAILTLGRPPLQPGPEGSTPTADAISLRLTPKIDATSTLSTLLDSIPTSIPSSPTPPTRPSPIATPTPAASPIPTYTPTPIASLEGMVKINAGSYNLGSTETDDFHVPLTKVSLATYWIDIYEITNTQYEAFLKNNASRPTPMTWPGRPKHPVRGTSWEDASAYCKSLNKRLPSEAEWEVAARGSTDTSSAALPIYPWGDDPMADGQANNLPRDDTYEVGSFAFNRSKLGVFDLDGNVLEWVDTPYAPIPAGPQNKILRGGRYGFLQDMAYRHFAESIDKTYGPYAGFRCAVSDRK